MSMDKSLKGKNTLGRHRNVLKRSERVDVLKESGRWTEDSTVIGMPKVGHRKVSVGKKEKKKDTDTAADDTAETPAKGDEKKS
jgi:small basic protein (TIGR04137 family)